MTSVAVVDPCSAGDRPLKRQMGLWMAVALIIGNMVGSGIFLLPAALAAAADDLAALASLMSG
jgi:amino acid transporter